MTSTTTPKRSRAGSDAVTNGVRISVEPSYSSLDSDPSNSYFKFVYRIRISNESDRPVQLVARHWLIVDADGGHQEVHGEGVVGQQPVVAPGRTFEYASFCPLGTAWGTMEGHYTMRWLGRPARDQSASPVAAVSDAAGNHDIAAPDADTFNARVARFFLVCPPEEQLSAID